MELWQRFTARARRAVLSAHSEATRSHTGLIGTEHLLLGLLRLREGGAHSVLQRLEVDVDQLRRGVDWQLEAGSSGELGDEITFTREAQSVLSFAYSETRALNSPHIGTEHILLGITRLDGDPVSVLLANAGVDQNRVRDAVAELPNEGNVEDSTSGNPQN